VYAPQQLPVGFRNGAWHGANSISAEAERERHGCRCFFHSLRCQLRNTLAVTVSSALITIIICKRRRGNHQNPTTRDSSHGAQLFVALPLSCPARHKKTGVRLGKRHGLQSLISLSRSANRSGIRALRIAST
jgi:hypothetical protein